MNEHLRRLIARLLPWWDTSAREQRSEDVLRKADLTLARHDMLREQYREASRLYGRVGGRRVSR